MLNELSQDAVPTRDVVRKIAALVAERFPWTETDGREIADARLREDLDLDSLHLVELQAAVEDHFAVVFDPEDEELLEAFTTVGSLAAYTCRLRGRTP